jgi:hypothetical protein
MIYARSGSEVMQSRTLVTSPGSGLQHWGAQFFGPRYVTTETSSAPQALMTDMSPDETILAHFLGVSQFQVFAGGAGKMARHDVKGLVVQFKDHHTAYGPVVAGAQGLRFFPGTNQWVHEDRGRRLTTCGRSLAPRIGSCALRICPTVCIPRSACRRCQSTWAGRRAASGAASRRCCSS